MKKNNILDTVIYVVAAIFLFALCFYLPSHNAFFTFEKEGKAVTIGRGDTAVNFVHNLKLKHLISNEKLALLFLKVSKIDRKLPTGTIKLTAGTPAELVRQLKYANPKYYAVTIIPGRTLRENAQLNSLDFKKLESELGKKENFPQALCDKLPKDSISRSVFLLPETYYLNPGDNIENCIVREASKLWVKRIGQEIITFDANKLLQYAIIASIVEGESRVIEDKAILAAIFFKRLAKPMRLQSCATVMYCWKEIKGVNKSKLSYSDLKIESPYNTYTHDGLPPTPINIPSADSWLAALKHESTEYLYFVADGKGKHIFSKTYSEHLQKQKELLR